jgi:trehalose-6-phosphate hydrolase
VFAYMRNWENETILVVNNFYGEEVTVGFDLKTVGNVEVLISNYKDSQLTLDELTLRPYESVVYYVR